jgi:hypothetical protein
MGHVLGLLQTTTIKVIAPAERHNPALAHEAVELELLEK